jgi:type II secretory pathway component PulF
MPTFAWEARTRAGDVRRGTIDADSEAMVMARLKAEQLNVVKVKKQ